MAMTVRDRIIGDIEPRATDVRYPPCNDLPIGRFQAGRRASLLQRTGRGSACAPLPASAGSLEVQVMEDEQKARMALLLRRQARSRRTPVLVEAWRNRAVQVSALSSERSEELVQWLRANWRMPDQHVTHVDQHIAQVVGSNDAVLAVDFWQWEEAIPLIVPTGGLLRNVEYLRELYVHGYLIADQLLSRGLLVNFDEEVEGAEVSQIGNWP
jgi:hypothetical protein